MPRNTLLYWFGWVVILVGSWFVLTATVLSSQATNILSFSADYSAESEINDAGWDLLRALSAIFGGAMIGWGITILYIAENYTRNAQKYLTIALLAWFITDSIGSLMNSLEYNVILNLGFLIPGLIILYWPNLRGQPLKD
ncbi:MAG: hypothetical protein ACFE68_02510 [Candidatus Hodarchaeota archaeon]